MALNQLYLNKMIKELQQKVNKLQNQNLRKQAQFNKKKQTYEDMITQLQNQNQKLKNAIADQSKISKDLSVSDAHSIVRQSQANQTIKQSIRRQFILIDGEEKTFDDLVKQNTFLRHELAELSKTYQLQIEQMTLYFQKIKKAYYNKISKDKIENGSAQPNGVPQVMMLMNAYETLLRDFDGQRAKYVNKIEELASYLTTCESKIKQMNDSNQQISYQLAIAEQQIKIYKRNNKSSIR